MKHRLVPAGLFAAAAALYWLVVFVVLRVVVPIRLEAESAFNDGCGGECTAFVSLGEVLGVIGISAGAAALVAAVLGPHLVARFEDRPEFVWRAAALITSGAYVLGFFGVLTADGVSGPSGFGITWQTALGLLFLSPFLLTALPFGMGAARMWHRFVQRPEV